MGNLFFMGASFFKLRCAGLARVLPIHNLAFVGLLVLSSGTINCKSTQTIGGGKAKAEVIKNNTAKILQILNDPNFTEKEKISAVKKVTVEIDKGADDLGESSDANQSIAETAKTENAELQKDSTTLHWIYGIAIGAAVLIVLGIVWKAKDKIFGFFTP